ncbi:MAG TPA: RDD family protein [Candidatus Sulfotelmatobacter sp.]|nr:RDD family protein [Candidatus Sulfotelmatobacter sp.]
MSITPVSGWGNSLLQYIPEQEGIEGVSFWPRVAARVIDLIILYVTGFFSGVLFSVMLVIASGGHVSPIVLVKLRHTGVMGFFFSILAAIAYHVIFTTVHGSTLGKLLMSIVVVGEDGDRCRLKSAIVRELGYFVDALFFGIIGYTAMKDTHQQQRHGDEWAHTVVCKRVVIAPEKLGSAGTFVVAFVFALAANSALIMTNLLLAISR